MSSAAATTATATTSHIFNFSNARLVRQMSNLSTEAMSKMRGLAHGSRTPTAAPAWVTLEVLHGGFASGRYAARLKEGEEKSSTYLQPDKMVELTNMLGTGKYKIETPENGALLVAAALLMKDDTVGFSSLIEEISPFLDELKFYPDASEHSAHNGQGLLFLRTVRDTVINLAKFSNDISNGDRCYKQFKQCHHADVIFALQNEMVQLVKATCASEGGYPFQQKEVMNEDWFSKAAELVKQFQALMAQAAAAPQPSSRRWYAPPPEPFERPSARFTKKKSTFNRLGKVLEALVVDNKNDVSSLEGKKHIGVARQCINDHIKAYPDASKYQAYLNQSKPLFLREVFAQLIHNRLTNKDNNIDNNQPLRVSIESVLQMPSAEELAALSVPPIGSSNRRRASNNSATKFTLPVQDIAKRFGSTKRSSKSSFMPRVVRRHLQLCTEGTVDDLIKNGIVKSNSQLGRVIDPLVASVSSSGLSDPVLRQLATAITVAFRRRRSLLLVNLESQVRVTELPWMKALYALESADSTQQATKEQLTRQTFQDVCMTNMNNWPGAVWANEFVSALNILSRSAGLGIPLLEEIAADIFMNEFGRKFVTASLMAARRFQGTLYEKYFQLEEAYSALLKADAEHTAAGLTGKDYDAKMMQVFNEHRMNIMKSYNNRSNDSGNFYILRNRREIEAVTIMTSHNIAQFVESFKNELDPSQLALEDMAVKAFKQVLSFKGREEVSRRTTFRWMKFAAVAWRQVVAYVSLSSTPSVILKALKEVASSPENQNNEKIKDFLDRKAAVFFELAHSGQLSHSEADKLENYSCFPPERAQEVAKLPPLPVTAWFEPPRISNNRGRENDRGGPDAVDYGDDYEDDEEERIEDWAIDKEESDDDDWGTDAAVKEDKKNVEDINE